MKRIGNDVLEKIKSKKENPNDDVEHFSISSILEQLKPEFDQQKVAEKTHAKNFNNPDSKYYRKSVEEIIEMWKEKGHTSTSNGSKLDDYIGMIINEEDTALWELDNLYDNDLLNNKCKAAKSVLDSLDKNGFGIITREEPLYIDIEVDGTICRVHGRLDALFGYETDKLYLYLIDWKNTTDITFTNQYQTMVGPCKHYANANGNVYKIQVEIYKYALVKTYGIYNEINLNIIQFPDEGSKSHSFASEDSFQEIEEMLKFGIKKIKLKREIAKKLKEKN